MTAPGLTTLTSDHRRVARRWSFRLAVAVAAGFLVSAAIMAIIATAGIMHPFDVEFESLGPPDADGRESMLYVIARDGFRYAEPMARVRTARGPVPNGDRATLAAGWPWLEASASIEGLSIGTQHAEGGIAIDRGWLPWTGVGPPLKAVIPLRPIWSGLLGNTLVWSAVVGLAWWSAARIRAIRLLRRRHVVAAALIAIVFGATTTVLIARWCARSLDPQRSLDLLASDAAIVEYAWAVDHGAILFHKRWGVAHAWRVEREPNRVPSGAEPLPWGIDEATLDASPQRVDDLAGWPFYAMRTVRIFGGSRLDAEGPDERATLTMESGEVSEDAEHYQTRIGRGRVGAVWPVAARLVPALSPGGIVWTGFLLDTLLFGALAFAALWACGRAPLRRTRRCRRGRCGECGHALAGAARCAECGAAAEVIARGPPSAAAAPDPTRSRSAPRSASRDGR